MRIKQGMCGLLMLLPLYGLAQTTSSDVIEGYTTQQIADVLPKTLDCLQRRTVEVGLPLSWWETHNPMFNLP
ncbi:MULTISPECIES: hypothetical protein [Symbiopectobacterium]|uniref:hypothetical protein n=1 Tax=Symbiopectobacterium TaxID=801 RepID=UPI001A24F03F|nr:MULTISPECIES: hypothetical protein [Symbiopectobacterium]MBG6247644.1 hypothetical protein [Candidatus Symbiopectobacterium sp. PLON1]MBT9429765.1 hypothetical protein [Candidatus Symbiopectobacterium endolongispinus]